MEVQQPDANSASAMLVRVSVTDQNLQKCLLFDRDSTVWTAKRIVLDRLAQGTYPYHHRTMVEPPADHGAFTAGPSAALSPPADWSCDMASLPPSLRPSLPPLPPCSALSVSPSRAFRTLSLGAELLHLCGRF